MSSSYGDSPSSSPPLGVSKAKLASPHPPTIRKWRRIIKAFEASGLTPTAFCRSQSLTSSSFYTWRKYFSQEVSQEKTPFITLTVEDSGKRVEPKGSDFITGTNEPLAETSGASKRFASRPSTIPSVAGSILVHLSNDLRLEVPPDFHSSSLKRLVQALSDLEGVSC